MYQQWMGTIVRVDGERSGKYCAQSELNDKEINNNLTKMLKVQYKE